LAKQYGFRASATLPIHCNGAMWAVFTVYHAQEDVFDTDLRVLLEALASNISRGLDRIELTRRERSNQLLNQAMLDTVTVGVILLKQRVVMRANQCAASFFGADDAEALVGKHAASLYISPDGGLRPDLVAGGYY
jgi:GAF domain-containing protein